MAEPKDLPVTDSATLQMLVQLMVAERQDALVEKQARQQAAKLKDEQRRINSEYSREEKNKSQAMCTHKKGGRGLKSPHLDYAVYPFTLTDASSFIKCQICGALWRKADTTEFLYRKGKQIPNHTGIGWKEACEMVSKSTNTAASAEVMMTTQPLAVDVRQLA